MTGKTIVYFVTKIRIVFEPAIFYGNFFLKSIFFLINQIAKRGQKSAFPQQTPKNDRKNDRFHSPKYKNSHLRGKRTGRKIRTRFILIHYLLTN